MLLLNKTEIDTPSSSFWTWTVSMYHKLSQPLSIYQSFLGFDSNWISCFKCSNGKMQRALNYTFGKMTYKFYYLTYPYGKCQKP